MAYASLEDEAAALHREMREFARDVRRIRSVFQRSWAPSAAPLSYLASSLFGALDRDSGDEEDRVTSDPAPSVARRLAGPGAPLAGKPGASLAYLPTLDPPPLARVAEWQTRWLRSSARGAPAPRSRGKPGASLAYLHARPTAACAGWRNGRRAGSARRLAGPRRPARGETRRWVLRTFSR